MKTLILLAFLGLTAQAENWGAFFQAGQQWVNQNPNQQSRDNNFQQPNTVQKSEQEYLRSLERTTNRPCNLEVYTDLMGVGRIRCSQF